MSLFLSPFYIYTRIEFASKFDSASTFFFFVRFRFLFFVYVYKLVIYIIYNDVILYELKKYRMSIV